VDDELEEACVKAMRPILKYSATEKNHEYLLTADFRVDNRIQYLSSANDPTASVRSIH
jgi:hypothetical protein